MENFLDLLYPLITLFFLAMLIGYFCFERASRQFTLYKFVKQKNTYFFNKKAFWLCISFMFFSLILFLSTAIYIITSSFLSAKFLIEVSSSLLLTNAVFLGITYFIIKSFSSSILFIIKNGQIIVDGQAIVFENITVITNDSRRKKILIHYINEEKQGKIITIKYNWELKDLIIENKINNSFI